jgi:hypothetical protein
LFSSCISWGGYKRSEGIDREVHRPGMKMAGAGELRQDKS